MKYFDWDESKNQTLQQERNISFEQVIVAINEGNILKIITHHNQKKYPNQHIFVIEINDYAYLVPYAEDDKKIFLKTIIPSRKATKQFLIN